MFLIPESAPPYDGESPSHAAAVAAAAGQGDSRCRPRERGAERGEDGRSRDRPDRPDRPGGPDRDAGPPAAPPWPSRFAQVLAETLAGSRPAGQMAPWTTEHVRDRIQRLGAQMGAGAGASPRPRVRRVVLSRPTPDAMEMTVVIGFGPRVRALALRLERDGSGPTGAGPDRACARWLCTAIEAA